MIPALLTPDHTYVLFKELVNRESPRFKQLNPIKRGTPYGVGIGADKEIISKYPDLVFCKETVPPGSNTVASMPGDEWVIWDWAAGRDSESTFNADISYLGDAVGNPVFARTYTVRRDEYEANPALPVAQPLTALIGLKVTKGGRDYTEARFSLIGPGQDWAADAVLQDGALVGAIVTAEGDGFDSTSVIQVIGDGTGAEVQPIIQPVTAILTSQKKQEFEESSPYSHEFVRVLRAYEVLPGPWIPFTRYDDDLGPVQGRRRAVLNQNQLGGEITASSKVNFEGREGSSVVLIEIQENWTDGTGAGFQNPPFPKVFRSTYTDIRGTVDQSSQIIVRPFFGAEATRVRTPGAPGNRNYMTLTYYEPYADNPYLTRQIIEVWIEPVIQDFKISSEHGGGIIEVDETIEHPGDQVIPVGLLITDGSVKTLTPDEQVLHSEKLFGLPGIPESSWPILNGAHTDEKTGIVLNFTKQVIDAYTPVPPRSGYRGPFVEDQPYDRWKTIRIITTPDCSTLPPDEDFYTTRPYSLPPTLLSLEAIWTDVAEYSSEAHDTSAKVIASSGSHGGLIITSRNGFRGHAVTKVTRRYKCGPFLPSEIPTPFVIIPSSGSVVFIEAQSTVQANGVDSDTSDAGTTAGNSFSRGGGLASASFDQRVHEREIGDHLVGNFAIINPTPANNRPFAAATATSGGGTLRAVELLSAAGPWTARMEVRIPQSTPTPAQLRAIAGAASPDNQILVEVTVEDWGYGIWVMHLYYVNLSAIYPAF
jgi:hypothetical protein